MAKFLNSGKKMRIRTILICIMIAVTLSGCLGYDLSRRVVQQGNLLPHSKVSQLQLGMSKEEVAVLLGNSLISPLFNQDRWDYAFTLRKGSPAPHVCNLVLYFKNDRLIKIEKSM